jgi:outer membrane protein TolC
MSHIVTAAAEQIIKQQHERIQELLDTNNRYLEEGRAARRELEKAQTTIDALAAQNVQLRHDLATKERELQHGSE